MRQMWLNKLTMISSQKPKDVVHMRRVHCKPRKIIYEPVSYCFAVTITVVGAGKRQRK